MQVFSGKSSESQSGHLKQSLYKARIAGITRTGIARRTELIAESVICYYVLLHFTFDNVKKNPFAITNNHTRFKFELHTCVPIWMRQLFQISLRSQMYVWKS